MAEAWTFGKVVRWIIDGRRSGLLRVEQAGREVRLQIDDGRLVGVQVEGFEELLADYLIESDTLRENQVARVRKRAARRSLPMVQLIVDGRLASQDVVKRFVELAARETVLPLFGASGIVCHFDKALPVPDPWLLPLPLTHLMKTAQKQLKDWGRVRALIPHNEVVFDKVDAYVKAVLGRIGPTLKIMDVSKAADSESSLVDEIGGNERVVYYYVNGKKTVTQVVHASGVGAFETYRALCDLAEKGYVRVSSERGRGERRKQQRVLLPMLLRSVAYTAAAVLVAALIVLRPGALSTPEGFIQVLPPALQQARSGYSIHRVEAAIETAYLRSQTPRAYPAGLDSLTTSGALTAEEVRDASADGRIYTLVGDDPARSWVWQRPHEP
ncbi:MAG: hypothetical protein ACI9WU_002723 [Myxococcota bacterium]|jgi:hypothetical protein